MEAATLKNIEILHNYLEQKGIDFILTGTTALEVYGLVPKNYVPGDIDIIVCTTSKYRGYVTNELRTLQNLSGFEAPKENYTNECYSFYIGENNTKVSAIVITVGEEEAGLSHLCVNLYVYDNKDYDCTIKIHTVDECLKAKFKLGRAKDHSFCNSLFATILSYFRKH